jgi:hypothetical protein
VEPDLGLSLHHRGGVHLHLKSGFRFQETKAEFDETHEVSGDGSAELLNDGSIKIEFACHNGDEAVLKAKRGRRQSAQRLTAS